MQPETIKASSHRVIAQKRRGGHHSVSKLRLLVRTGLPLYRGAALALPAASCSFASSLSHLHNIHLQRPSNVFIVHMWRKLYIVQGRCTLTEIRRGILIYYNRFDLLQQILLNPCKQRNPTAHFLRKKSSTQQRTYTHPNKVFDPLTDSYHESPGITHHLSTLPSHLPKSRVSLQWCLYIYLLQGFHFTTSFAVRMDFRNIGTFFSQVDRTIT
jgi:hypothetical protein